MTSDSPALPTDTAPGEAETEIVTGGTALDVAFTEWWIENFTLSMADAWQLCPIWSRCG
jgi:hypothetical protein